MNDKLSVLAMILFTAVSIAEAQPQAKVAKIGWLGARTPGPGSGREFFERELRALGYIEGKNIVIESRYADNKLDRLPALAEELVHLKVDVLIAPTTVEVLAAKNATRTIPIGLEGTSRGLPPLPRCWLVSDWSYSRKPFQISPALRCCGIPESSRCATMERKPAAGTRAGTATPFHGS